jgi:ribosome biogenesis protein MAK21
LPARVTPRPDGSARLWGGQTVSDRYYRALYDLLLDPRLGTAAKPALLLNLLYRALKADPSVVRAQAFAKRLLQVALAQAPPLTCALLLVVSELLKHRPALWLLVQQPPAGADEEGGADGAAARGYDPRKREPLAAHADASALWELVRVAASQPTHEV